MSRPMSLVAAIIAFMMLAEGRCFRRRREEGGAGRLGSRKVGPGEARCARHADTAPASAGGNGDGTNALPFTQFESGDMVVTGGTLTGHAGEWDSRLLEGLALRQLHLEREHAARQRSPA